jgi:toxin ParE1/3/4
MKPVRISDQASESLAEIAYWTAKNFGPAQEQLYIETIIAKMNGIAKGTVNRQRCRDVFALDLLADLCLTRAGRHFIIFTETPTEIHVIDFIHQSADIGGRLGGPDE